jgi:hypothetical protein
VVLEFEFRASHLLGRPSTTWTTSATHIFTLVIFWIGSYVFASGGRDHALPIYASHVSGMTGVHHTQLIAWDRMLLTFCLSWSQYVFLLISAFWEAGITTVSHCEIMVFLNGDVLCCPDWLQTPEIMQSFCLSLLSNWMTSMNHFI